MNCKITLITILTITIISSPYAQEQMEVEGAIKIEAAQNASNGTIQYNSATDDFLGKTSTGGWKSFTTGNGLWAYLNPGNNNDIIYHPSPTGKVYIGGNSGGGMLNVIGNVPSMLQLRNAGPNNYIQLWKNGSQDMGLIGVNSSNYFDFSSRPSALGVRINTNGTPNAIVVEDDGKVNIQKAIKVGELPAGDTPSAGDIRWNNASNDFEGYINTGWKSLTNSSSSPSGVNTVTDIDGNKYLTVVIGTQTWMRENLKVSKFNDGTSIQEITLNADWVNAGSGWCWYDNDFTNDEIYGKLYTYEVVDLTSNGSKNVCPAGWHVPVKSEWELLNNFLSVDQGGKMKSTGNLQNGTGLWETPNTGSTNESGFTGVPSGYRFGNSGDFSAKRARAFYWARDDEDGAMLLRTDQSTFNTNYVAGINTGLAIRCIKD